MAADLTEPATETSADDRTYPPFWIKRLQIRNFKSIEFADFTLEPLTVFVGRNGAGKSNVLDALGFLGSVLSHDLRSALRRYGGVESIARRGSGERLQFEPEFSSGPTSESVMTWSIAIDLDSHPKIVSEIGKLGKHTFSWAHGEPEFLGMIKASPDILNAFRETLTQRAWLKIMRSGETARFADALGDASVYRFEPSAIRTFTRPVRRTGLMQDGSNAAQVLDVLRGHDDWGYSRLCSRLASVVPNLRSAEAVVYNSSLIDLLFHFEASTPDLRVFPAPNVSDGTLRALVALLSAFQVRPNIADDQSNDQAPLRPAIVAIEEPETSLHPAALDALIFGLDAATEHTQVLLSTHNADWLGAPPVGVERVRVVQMVDGKTVVGPVDAASREILKLRIDSLADMQRSGHLEADPDDLARQSALRAAAL